MPGMIKVMFICHGNICRSPLAEFLFRKMATDENLGDEIDVCSRATSCEEIFAGKGSPIYPPVTRALDKHGIPYNKDKCSVQTTAEECRDYDFLIIMDSRNYGNMAPLFDGDASLEKKIWKMLDFDVLNTHHSNPADMASMRLKGNDIADPWFTGDFPHAYEEIEKGCKGLLIYIKYLVSLKKIHNFVPRLGD